RYMHQYGATREHMAAFILNNRANARLNPHAYFRDAPPLTKEDYLNSRILADPVCLLDCDIPVDGAIAIVLTTAERARDLRHRPAYVAGYGKYVGSRIFFQTPAGGLGPPLDEMQAAGRLVADRMWK